MAKSILPTDMRGVAFVTGRRGVGKTYFVSQLDNPANVAFFAFEQKAEGVDEQLHFGKFFPITELASGKGPLGMWQEIEKAIANLEQDRYTVVVFDNVSPLELALQAEANRNAQQYAKDFGLNLKNVQEGRFGGLKAIVNFLVTERVCGPLHAKGVKLIAVTAHTSARWAISGPIPNKYNVKGADRWQELSMLTLILVPGEFAPIPAALVQKEQLGSITWDEEKQDFAILRRLPLRMPKATVVELRRYLAEPADLLHPKPGETPTYGESDPYSEDLSKEQLNMMVKMMELAQAEEALPTTAAATNPGAIMDGIKVYLADHENATNDEISKAVEGATLPLIMRARKG